MEQVIEEIEQFKNKIKEERRTTRTPNDLILFDNHAEIVLRDKKQKIVGICKIDKEDIVLIKGFKWHITHMGYCEGYVNKNNIKLHRFLLNPSKEEQIDHMNHNRLDNRRKNIRIVTAKINSNNQRKREMIPIYNKKEVGK